MVHYGEVERTGRTKCASHQRLSSSNTSNFVWVERFLQRLPPRGKRQEPCVPALGLLGPAEGVGKQHAGWWSRSYYPHIVQKRGLES